MIFFCQTLVIFIRQFTSSSMFICLTEIILYKVLMLHLWKKICSIDEEFLSRITLIFNIGLQIVTQICRWMLGAFDTYCFEFLTGKFLINVFHSRIYWPTCLTINCCIILTGCFALSIKKYVEYKKDQNIVHRIHIGLEDQHSG